jgi:DNA repair exonuclease SbcCD ATPase subunit
MMRAASNDDEQYDDDSFEEEPPETQQPARLGNWTKGLGGAAKAAARRLGDKALATLEDTLDAAEERLLEPEEQDVTDDGRDPFDDARVQAALEQLRADSREELELQRETFESRIEELEACAASEFDGKADRVASNEATTSDVVAVLCAAALRGAGVDDATSLSAELARETTKDASIRLEAAVASSKTPATGGDLDKLRAQFEAARKARDQEATRLREEASSARSLAATKADEAAEERKHATTARDDAAQALQKADKAEARSKRVDERRRAAEAACGAALAERDSLNLVLQSREATASSSRRRLDAAAQDADQQAALGRLLKKRCEDAEEAAAAAKTDRDRVEAARKNLERVVRSFEQKASDAESNLKRDHALQISALEGDVEDAQQQIRELEASLKAARASEQARDVAAARAEAECQAARAAAMAACADVAALKDVLLRPPDPVPVVEREASVSKPRRGFAAWLNEIVDAELES